MHVPHAQGEPELADHDEPGNAWYFGERAEIFDYKLLGEHPTKSGGGGRHCRMLGAHL